MIALLTAFLGPTARTLGMVLAGAVAFSVWTGGVYLKGRLNERSWQIAHMQQEAAQADAKANDARAAADKKFTDGKFNNRPSFVPGRVRHGSDGFARD
jgi:hypothetical protein